MPKYDHFNASDITLLTPENLKEEAKTQLIQINTLGLTPADLKELEIQPLHLFYTFN